MTAVLVVVVSDAPAIRRRLAQIQASRKTLHFSGRALQVNFSVTSGAFFIVAAGKCPNRSRRIPAVQSDNYSLQGSPGLCACRAEMATKFAPLEVGDAHALGRRATQLYTQCDAVQLSRRRFYVNFALTHVTLLTGYTECGGGGGGRAGGGSRRRRGGAGRGTSAGTHVFVRTRPLYSCRGVIVYCAEMAAPAGPGVGDAHASIIVRAALLTLFDRVLSS